MDRSIAYSRAAIRRHAMDCTREDENSSDEEQQRKAWVPAAAGSVIHGARATNHLGGVIIIYKSMLAYGFKSGIYMIYIWQQVVNLGQRPNSSINVRCNYYIDATWHDSQRVSSTI